MSTFKLVGYEIGEIKENKTAFKSFFLFNAQAKFKYLGSKQKV